MATFHRVVSDFASFATAVSRLTTGTELQNNRALPDAKDPMRSPNYVKLFDVSLDLCNLSSIPLRCLQNVTGAFRKVVFNREFAVSLSTVLIERQAGIVWEQERNELDKLLCFVDRVVYTGRTKAVGSFDLEILSRAAIAAVKRTILEPYYESSLTATSATACVPFHCAVLVDSSGQYVTSPASVALQEYIHDFMGHISAVDPFLNQVAQLAPLANNADLFLSSLMTASLNHNFAFSNNAPGDVGGGGIDVVNMSDIMEIMTPGSMVNGESTLLQLHRLAAAAAVAFATAAAAAAAADEGVVANDVRPYPIVLRPSYLLLSGVADSSDSADSADSAAVAAAAAFTGNVLKHVVGPIYRAFYGDSKDPKNMADILFACFANLHWTSAVIRRKTRKIFIQDSCDDKGTLRTSRDVIFACLTRLRQDPHVTDKAAKRSWKLNDFSGLHNHCIELVSDEITNISQLPLQLKKSLEDMAVAAPMPVMRTFAESWLLNNKDNNPNGSSFKYVATDLLKAIQVKARRGKLDSGQAMDLLVRLQALKQKDPNFTLLYQVDKDNKLTRLFLQTGLMRNLARKFSDFVLADTVYGTNEREFPVTLGGIVDNNGKVRVVFAALTGESGNDHTWTMEQYLVACGGVAPTVIACDFADALRVAVFGVLKDSKLINCNVHLERCLAKADKAVYYAPHDVKTFLQDFRVAQNQISVAQFKVHLASLLQKYPNFQPYYNRELQPKEKEWARYARVSFFTAGADSTNSQESLNAALKKSIGKRVSLVAFVLGLVEYSLRKGRDAQRIERKVLALVRTADSIFKPFLSDVQEVFSSFAVVHCRKLMSYSSNYDVHPRPRKFRSDSARFTAIRFSCVFRPGPKMSVFLL